MRGHSIRSAQRWPPGRLGRAEPPGHGGTGPQRPTPDALGSFAPRATGWGGVGVRPLCPPLIPSPEIAPDARGAVIRASSPHIHISGPKGPENGVRSDNRAFCGPPRGLFTTAAPPRPVAADLGLWGWPAAPQDTARPTRGFTGLTAPPGSRRPDQRSGTPSRGPRNGRATAPWRRRWRLSGAHSSAFLGLAHFQGIKRQKGLKTVWRAPPHHPVGEERRTGKGRKRVKGSGAFQPRPPPQTTGAQGGTTPARTGQKGRKERERPGQLPPKGNPADRAPAETFPERKPGTTGAASKAGPDREIAGHKPPQNRPHEGLQEAPIQAENRQPRNGTGAPP